MAKPEVIFTERAPDALGPYSQAIKAGSFVFTAGQIALDRKTNKLVEGDIRDQTRQVLTNLEHILKAAGCDWKNVVKSTIFLTDLGDFGAMNEEYGSKFGASPPARSTVQVSRLPLDAKVEIDLVAFKG
jgi:2-iminobutanoate/2-iminopropanoate deaminase